MTRQTHIQHTPDKPTQRVATICLLLFYFTACRSTIYETNTWKHTTVSKIESGPILGVVDGPPEIVGTDLVLTIGYCKTAKLDITTREYSAKVRKRTILEHEIAQTNWSSPSDILSFATYTPIALALSYIAHAVRNTFVILPDQDMHYRASLIGFALSYLAPIRIVDPNQHPCVCETQAVQAWASGANWLAITIDGTPLVPIAEQSGPQVNEHSESATQDDYRAMPTTRGEVMDSNTWRHWYVSNSIGRSNVLQLPHHDRFDSIGNTKLTNKDPTCHFVTNTEDLELVTPETTRSSFAILAQEKEPITFWHGVLHITSDRYSEEIAIDTAQVVRISLIPFVLKHIESTQANQDLELHCDLGWDLPLTIPHNQVVRILAEHWITEGL